MMSRNPMSPANRTTTLVMVAVCLVITIFATVSARSEAAPRDEVSAKVPPRAPMLPGCNGRYRKHTNFWNQQTVVTQYVLLPRPHPEPRPVTHSSDADYIYCPYKGGPARLRVVSIGHCHLLRDGGSDFDGAWYESYIYDSSDRAVNMEEHFVEEGPRSRGYANCEDQIVPRHRQKWMLMRNDPRRNEMSANRREGALIDETWWNWDTPDGEVRFFHPHADPHGDWRYPPSPN